MRVAGVIASGVSDLAGTGATARSWPGQSSSRTGKMTNIWMPLYTADYLADTGHLATIEHGAYLLLIMHYWQKEVALPDSDQILAQIARLRIEQWRKIRPKLEPFFQVQLGKVWMHDKIERELKKAADLREKKRQAGIASGNARSTGVQHLTQQDTQQNGNQPQSQSKIVDLKGFSIGKNGGKTEHSSENRLALFQKWLAETMGAHGWKIVGEASDPTNPNYSEAVTFCKKFARENGKGWPHQWPA